MGEMNDAYVELMAAARKLEAVWNQEVVEDYPRELPSFDELVQMLTRIQIGDDPYTIGARACRRIAGLVNMGPANSAGCHTLGLSARTYLMLDWDDGFRVGLYGSWAPGTEVLTIGQAGEFMREFKREDEAAWYVALLADAAQLDVRWAEVLEAYPGVKNSWGHHVPA